MHEMADEILNSVVVGLVRAGGVVVPGLTLLILLFVLGEHNFLNYNSLQCN